MRCRSLPLVVVMQGAAFRIFVLVTPAACDADGAAPPVWLPPRFWASRGSLRNRDYEGRKDRHRGECGKRVPEFSHELFLDCKTPRIIAASPNSTAATTWAHCCEGVLRFGYSGDLRLG